MQNSLGRRKVPATTEEALCALRGMAATAPGASAAVDIAEFPVSDTPEAISAGPDGNVWFTQKAGRVGRISPTGAVTEFPVGLVNLNGITTGPDGALWVTGNDAFGDRIGRVTTAGEVSVLPLPSANSQPSGIASGPDGALWFTEVIANKIGRITTAGDVSLYSIPTPGALPFAIAAGPDGAIWFAEYGAGKIGRITTGGSITEFPTCCFPTDIAPGPDGAMWFAQRFGNAIGRITASGEISTFPVPRSPFGIAAGPDGALWFTENSANQLGRLTTSGVVSEFPIPTADSSASAITTGPDGNIWFLEAGANKVGRLLVGAQDNTPPTITVNSPAEGASYPLGAEVLADYACSDEPGGSGVVSCLGDLANGARVGTSTVGERSFSISAKDNAGNVATQTVHYRVSYDFTGFASPINNRDAEGNYVLNKAKPGSAIPIKFSLNGDRGLAIFESGYPKTETITCDPTAEVDGIEETTTPRNSALSYDATTDRYTYVWKTDTAWQGCRQLVLKLADGSAHRASFTFDR